MIYRAEAVLLSSLCSFVGSVFTVYVRLAERVPKQRYLLVSTLLPRLLTLLYYGLKICQAYWISFFKNEYTSTKIVQIRQRKKVLHFTMYVGIIQNIFCN